MDLTGADSGRRDRPGSPALRDLAVVSAIAGLAFLLASAAGAAERLHRWLEAYEGSMETLVASSVAAVGLAVFSGLRWREARGEVARRHRTEAALRQSERRYRSLVEQVPVVVYVNGLEEAAPAMYVSPQYETLLGYKPDERLADPELWVKRLHPEDRERVLAQPERPDGTWGAEYRLIARDGRVVWVRDEALLVRDDDGHPLCWQGVLIDITDRKLIEESLRGSELREREAAKRLRALDEMKNTFLAAVSHELRSPLTSILGLALTLEKQDDLSPDDRSDLLGRLGANARKLDRLLKDLLDIDRLSRGIVTPQCRPTDIGALARLTVGNLETLGERSVSVHADPVMAVVDQAKVERILENLLANAMRHTKAEVRIWVLVREEEGGALIAVEDEGSGVPDGLRDAIFEPFRRGEPGPSNAAGTGIGLSLVTRFAELHGGRAWVEEREGGGASFRVWLPSNPPGEWTGDTGLSAGQGLDLASSG